MSADLFAQFGSFADSNSSAPSQRQGQSQGQAGNTPAQPPDSDPFTFLSSAFSQPPRPPQRPQQVSSQPPPAYTAPAQSPQPWSSFGVPSQPSQPAQTPQPSLDWGSANTWGSSAVAAPAQPVASGANGSNGINDEEDDAWGDFEEASPGTQDLATQTLPEPQSQFQHRPQPTAAPPAQPPIRTRVVRAPTLDLLSNSLINLGDIAPAAGSAPPPRPDPTPQSPPRQPWMNGSSVPSKTKKPSDPDVLFDVADFDENALPGDDDDDDDEFGDFETGDSSPPRTISASIQNAPQSVAPTTLSVPAASAAATSLIDLLSLSDPEPVASTSSPSLPIEQTFSSLGFGQQPPRAKHPHAASHLSPLSFGSTATLANLPQTPKSPSFKDRNPFPGLAVTTPISAQFPTEKVQNRTPSPVTNWPTFDSNGSFPSSPEEPKPKAAVNVPQLITGNDWDAWDAADSAPVKPPLQSSQPAKSNNVAKPAPVTSDWDWGAEDQPSQQDLDAPVDLPSGITSMSAARTVPDNAPPPTNVPPPSILLSLFPTLMALPDETLFKPTASQPAEVRNRVLSHPKTIAFLRNYLQIIVVAVRVIAGRKQRWHRDRFLSQSMSISAAGSSKGGGMKLAGIDKTQSQREDREAADVVAAWRRYVGKLRSAVATANTALVEAEAADYKHYPPLKIPELQSETVAVTVAKQVPTSTRPCVVCGLKRDERVRGVDDDVQDIFGEWWVEHWGHRACRNFWAEHEATLRSK